MDNIESYDIGIAGNILPLLQQRYQLTTLDTALLAIASTLGIVVAIIPAGWLADTIGREKVLIIGTAWYAVFSLFCGFAPNVLAIIVLRFISGFGMGAVFPIPYAMATELMPGNRRGAMVGILDSFLSFGYFLALLIAFALVPLLPAGLGWRVLFFIGVLPLLYIPIIFKWMPESPRWLQAKGRDNEADGIVRVLETRIEHRPGKSLPPPQTRAKITRLNQARPIVSAFQKAYLKRTLMMCVAFSCILFVMRETGVSVFESVGRLFGGVLAPSIMAFLLAT